MKLDDYAPACDALQQTLTIVECGLPVLYVHSV